jgi:hypothetical protein
MIKFARADILTAFDERAIGTRVIDVAAFLGFLHDACESFDFADQTTPGQGVVILPPEAFPTVSGGVGPKVDDVDAYVLRSWRGKIGAYLKRVFASPVESLGVVVYTLDAYLRDPDVVGYPTEFSRVQALEPTHVIVAVLAGSGAKPPAYTPHRLVANLAGGNRDALAWDADTIREKARECFAHASAWSVVAD